MLSRPVLSHVKTVAIVRALNGLGDLLCVVPALRALRAGLPEAHVSLITMPEVGDLVSRFSGYVDEMIPFAGFPGIPEKQFDPADLPEFYRSMAERHFDLAVQMQGNGLVSNSLTVMLGARRTAGFYLPGHYCPDAELFLPYPARLPEVRRHLALMEFLGCPLLGDGLEFPVTGADRDEARSLIAALTPEAERSLRPGEYVCVHPGAVAKARRWSPVGFARVADALAAEGLDVVFTGQAEEAGLVAMTRGLMNAPSLNLAGMTRLGSLAALLEGARLLVCNDTGVSHLAAALRVPSVIVFAGDECDGSDPARWAPLDRRLHRAVSRGRGLRPGPVAWESVLDAALTQLHHDGVVPAPVARIDAAASSLPAGHRNPRGSRSPLRHAMPAGSARPVR